MTQSATASPFLVRMALVAMALSSWQGASQIFESGNYAASSLSLFLQVFSYGFGFVLLVLASRTDPPRYAAALTLAAGLLTFVDYAAVHRANQAISGTPLTTDVHLFTDYAAYLIRHGINPYEADLIESYRAHRAPMNFSTPLIDGDLTGRLAYPALHPLTYVPFQMLGIPTIWVYPLLLVACWLGVFFAAREDLRPIALVPFFVDHRYMMYALGGVSDFGWAALVTWMVVAWNRPVARSVLYGLACSYKHHPWLMAPFFLVRIYAETEGTPRDRLLACARFTGGSVAAFAVVNLPFALWDPVAWFNGVTEPAAAAMITWGQGLSTLTSTGALVIPKSAHGIALYGGLALVLAAYAAYGRRYRELMWLAPGIALFMGHRSLTSYWYFTALPLVAAVVSPIMQNARWDLTIPGAERVRYGLGAVGVGALVFLAWLPLRTPPLALEVLRVDVDGGASSGMVVNVTNHSGRNISPAFQVQAWAMQPLHWDVVSGPRVLADGDEATYYIESSVPFERFDIRAGAQLVLTDRGRYEPRVATRVQGDLSIGHPDAVPNGDWRFWAANGVPAFWGRIARPSEAGSIELLTRQGRRALMMELTPHDGGAELLLDTYILMPSRPLQIAIYVDEDANQLPNPAIEHGLQLWAGGEPLRVLFGPERTAGTLPGGQRFVMLPVPVGEWHTVEVDVHALMAEAGLIEPAKRTTFPRFHHLDFPMVPTHVQLLLATHDNIEARAYFGQITQDLDGDVDALYAQAQAAPEMGLLWRGEYNVANGNLAKGLDMLREAAALAPDDGNAQFRLADALLRSGRASEAKQVFARARDLGYLPAASEIGIGWAELGLEDTTAAHDAFQRSLMLPPDMKGDRSVRAQAHKGLSYVATAAGDCITAQAHLSTASAYDASVVPPDATLPCHPREAPEAPPEEPQ